MALPMPKQDNGEPMFPVQERLGIVTMPIDLVVGGQPFGRDYAYRTWLAGMDGCIVLSATTCKDTQRVLYLIAHPALPHVPSGGTAPEYDVMLHCYRDGRVRRLGFRHLSSGKEFLTVNS